MGTRADFYIGTGKDAEWLGSVAWDGYEWEELPDCPLMTATTETDFRAAVAESAASRRDWTSPADGWPWPWDDSTTTDRAYAFANGRVTVYRWGKGAEWPDMGARQNVTLGPRSGLIVGIKI